MICIFLCFALGIANCFHISLVIIFSILCLYVLLRPCFSSLPKAQVNANVQFSVSCFLIVFIEVPLLLRICPTSAKFDTFMRRFTTNYMRAAFYGILALVQWLSLIVKTTSLVAAAVFLTIAAFFYLLAAVKGQGFVGSKTLGGQGVAQMII